jgi:hypothetical protein
MKANGNQEVIAVPGIVSVSLLYFFPFFSTLTQEYMLDNGEAPVPLGTISSADTPLGRITGMLSSIIIFSFSSYKTGIGSPQNLCLEKIQSLSL